MPFLATIPGMSKRRQRRKPLPKETEQAEIETLSHDGRGIARINGKTTFIADALPGETITFTYTGIKGSYDEGKTQTVLTPSTDRVTPPCQHFGVCGGCALQHMHPDRQIKHKETVFLEQLVHGAHTKPSHVLTPLTAKTIHYRYKARIGVKHVAKKEKVLIGFRERDGRFVADLTHCPILHPAIGEKLPAFSELIASLSIYHKIPQLEIAIGQDANAVIIRHLANFSEADLSLLAQFGETHTLRLYLQPKGPDSIQIFYPKNASHFLHYDLPAYQLRYAFSPEQFTQINHDINEKMIAQALDLLDPSPTDAVLDLFCGIGNFSLPIAKAARFVLGIEGDQKAVKQAQNNAQTNQINNSHFYEDNLFDAECFPRLLKQYKQHGISKIILDPPRAGAELLCQKMGQLSPEKIVYISCKASTFARDAKHLIDQGYVLTHAGIMDMFPHTAHFECMGCFEKSNAADSIGRCNM